MADPFIAEIRIFTFNFAPRGWVFCDGQELLITQNRALFALLGTMYGGNGSTTFALPDLRGRAALHHGLGPGLTEREQGATGGAEQVTLSTAEMPRHRHALKTSAEPATTPFPNETRYFARPPATRLYAPATATVPLAEETLRVAGRGADHENMMPYLTFHFCIALDGIFPSRWP